MQQAVAKDDAMRVKRDEKIIVYKYDKRIQFLDYDDDSEYCRVYPLPDKRDGVFWLVTRESIMLISIRHTVYLLSSDSNHFRNLRDDDQISGSIRCKWLLCKWLLQRREGNGTFPFEVGPMWVQYRK